MKIPKLLIIIFLIVLLFRLYFTLQTDYFSDDSSYSFVRSLDSIKENAKPADYDNLSYGGKPVLVSLILPYILWLFSLIPLGLKIFSQILISLTVFIVYIIAKEIINDEKSALLASLLSGFIPLYISQTLNKISVYFLAIPLVFLMIYCFKNIDKTRYRIAFFILSLLASLLDPIFIIFVFVFIFYLLILYTEDIKIHKTEIITAILFIFLITIINFLMLKNAIFTYGFEVIYKNIPKTLLLSTFKKIDVLTMIYHLGYIPLVFGGISLYYSFAKEKSRIVFLLSSLMLVSLSLLALKILDFYAGMMLIGISASILSALAISRLFLYLNLTKIAKYRQLFVPIFILFILILSIYPSYTVSKKLVRDAPTDTEVNSLLWINNDSLENDVVLGTIYEGNLISKFSGRKNFFDTNFLFAPDLNQRLLDAERMFTSDYDKALPLFKQYNIKYIYLSNKAKDIYAIKELKYLNSPCLEKHDFAYKIIC